MLKLKANERIFSSSAIPTMSFIFHVAFYCYSFYFSVIALLFIQWVNEQDNSSSDMMECEQWHKTKKNKEKKKWSKCFIAFFIYCEGAKVRMMFSCISLHLILFRALAQHLELFPFFFIRFCCFSFFFVLHCSFDTFYLLCQSYVVHNMLKWVHITLMI